MPLPVTLDAPFPIKFQLLFQPLRYKVLYGGRGSGKSWNIARALLLKGVQAPLRVLCVRELQNSIDDSVHRLLSDQISLMGLGSVYEIQKNVIYGPNGTSFKYEGVRNNVTKIKSYEGVDVCWAEEADKISDDSWNILIPTIRKEGSEIIISFNPNLRTDATYKRFVLSRQPDAWVEHFTYRDNPWFTDTLRREMETLKERDYDAYLNVWEGQTKLLLEGAVYAKELRAARQDKRICRVPVDDSVGVEAFFDLGWDDYTTVWLRQRVGFQLRYFQYYQNRQQSIKHYLGWLRSQGHLYSMIWLPHDARKSDLGTGLTIYEQVKAQGFPVKVVKRLGLEDGINAARTIFSQCWFDEVNCEVGLQQLGAYRYEIVEEGQTLKRSPVHDYASHAADSFRYSAVAGKAPKVESETAVEEKANARALGMKTGRFGQGLGGPAWLGH